MADKGTLFLDEVGDIPQALQPKLPRLCKAEFERLGASHAKWMSGGSGNESELLDMGLDNFAMTCTIV
jgi:hypothetical protein